MTATWYGRLQRCQAELSAWAQIRSAIIMKLSRALLVESERRDPRVAEWLEAAGVTRTEATVRHYCDAPVWEWWQ